MERKTKPKETQNIFLALQILIRKNFKGNCLNNNLFDIILTSNPYSPGDPSIPLGPGFPPTPLSPG